MASRDFLKHTVSPSEPTSGTLGDEWYDPSTNKLYKRLAVDGTTVKYQSVSGSNVIISDFAPKSPVLGDLWWDSTIGQLRVYYSNNDTAQWVDAVNTQGLAGKDGINGTDGVGIPVGGTTGQVLSKVSATNYDVAWSTVSGGSGATLTNDTTTNSNAYYPAMATATTGSWTTAYVSSTKMYFNPSTGTLNATEFQALSDISQKTNITKIADASTIIDQLTGVEFDWKDTGNKSAGVIAQDLEVVLPHLVNVDERGIRSVNYLGIIAYLIESNKELLRRVESLENR